MFENFITNINWVDIVLIVIIVRGMYIGFKSSFAVELFKLLGALASIFVTLHYFLGVGKFLHETLAFKANFTDLLAFVLLWIPIVFVFKLIRDGIFLIFKIKAGSEVDGGLGLIVAGVRSIFICSLTLMLLYVSREAYLVKQAQRSVIGQYVENWAPEFYKFSFKNICGNFFPEEKINQKVFSLARPDKNSEANQK